MRNPYQSYQDNYTLTADPIELVRLLYRSAITSLKLAQTHQAAGRILERTAEVNRALEIVSELVGSLDMRAGGEIAHRLACLYEYVLFRITQGNIEQDAAQFAEAERLLKTLAEGWEHCSPKENEWEPAMVA